MDLAMSRGRVLMIVAALILLSFVAEKSRQLVGDERSSKSGKFSWFDCFDMGTGTVACTVKEGIKLYTYNIRAGIVERARHKAYELALEENLYEGLSVKDAAKQAQVAGRKAGKLASRRTRRITGPIFAGAWDFFEAIYYGGGLGEASLRGLGTVCGTWGGGLEGEKRLGRLGYLVGSHIGSWIGGRLGLMIYDIGNAVSYVASTVKGYVVSEDESTEAASYEEGRSYEEF